MRHPAAPSASASNAVRVAEQHDDPRPELVARHGVRDPAGADAVQRDSEHRDVGRARTDRAQRGVSIADHAAQIETYVIGHGTYDR